MKTFLISVLFFVTYVSGLELCSDELEPREDYCAKTQSYNKQQNPDFPNPTTVHLEIIIREIVNVDVENHLVEFIAYSNIWWTDPRVDIKSISKDDGQTARPTDQELNELWLTDVNYANAIHIAKRFKYHTATKDKDTGLLNIKLTMLYRIQVTCEMDFSTFPFDSHTCFWKFRSHYENIGNVSLFTNNVNNDNLKLFF